MTDEEARNYICQNWFDGYGVEAFVSGDKETEVMFRAVKALEKQMPRKSTRAYCPCCGEILGIANYTKKICSCGQKLEFT